MAAAFIEQREVSRTSRQRVVRAVTKDAVGSSTASDSVAPRAEIDEIVAVVRQRNDVVTVAGCDQNAGVAGYRKTLLAPGIIEDNGLQRRKLIGVNLVGAGSRNIIDLRGLRGRERRRSGHNRYQTFYVCYALRGTLCDQKAVDPGAEGINALALQQRVKCSEVHVVQRIAHVNPPLYCAEQYGRRSLLNGPGIGVVS